MTNPVNQELKQRRSIYALGKNVSQTPAQISETIKEAIRQSPTAFNSQTVRAVITFGENSDRVWDIVEAELKKLLQLIVFLRPKKRSTHLELVLVRSYTSPKPRRCTN